MVRRLGLGKNNHLSYASLALNPRSVFAIFVSFLYPYLYSWATTWENLLACAPNPRSLFSLHCPHEETLHSWLSKMCPVKILIRWMHKLIWIFTGCTCQKVSFLMLQVIQYCLSTIVEAVLQCFCLSLKDCIITLQMHLLSYISAFECLCVSTRKLLFCF